MVNSFSSDTLLALNSEGVRVNIRVRDRHEVNSTLEQRPFRIAEPNLSDLALHNIEGMPLK